MLSITSERELLGLALLLGMSLSKAPSTCSLHAGGHKVHGRWGSGGLKCNGDRWITSMELLVILLVMECSTEAFEGEFVGEEEE